MTSEHATGSGPDESDRTRTADFTSEGREIGRYKLLQKIGEGGMGEVWLAEQSQPIKRRVALKIIKLGMDTKQVIARFEAERQALALMNHPCIAKVFDAGATQEGRPYFVMEYVSGPPITEYCDRNKLTTPQRLEVFRKVCEGVHHAHQKAIVHRDLKPSNILVTDQDGQTLPRIIDFGLAKATAHALTDKTMVTQFGMLMGTPEYMSPEQADFTVEDVDTRTDVYSLGVVLYQLLTGSLPFTSEEIQAAGLDGIRELLRNKQPRKPSTVVSDHSPRSEESAALRRVSPKLLHSQLSGDLDWITMKSLEKDRARRYDSAQALADDLGRYLTARPVTARPPSKWYAFRKFARRHRVAFVGGLFVFLALIAGGVSTTIGFIRAAKAQKSAEAQAHRAEKVSQFLFSMIGDADFFETGSHEFTVADMIARAEPRIDQELAGDQEIQGSLRHQLGDVYFGSGDFERAEALMRHAIADFEACFGGPSLKGEEARACLCWVLQKSDRYEETVAMATLGAETARKLNRDPSVLEARFFDLIGDTYRYMGRLVEAEEYMRKSCDMFEMVESEVPMWVENDLALVYQQSGKLDSAESIFRSIYGRNLALFGEAHHHTSLFMANLAHTLAMQGKYAEAEEWYRRNLALRSRVLGPDHPFTKFTKSRLDEVVAKQNDMP